MKFKVPESILSIKPYVPGKPIEEFQREYGIDHPVKLASNENPFGCSPKAIEAVQNALGHMNRYPDASSHQLTRKLAETYGVQPHNIVVGNGSDEIIALLCHAFLDKGDEALMPHPTFLMYEICVNTAKGSVVNVPLGGFDINLDGLARRIGPKTRIVFLTNPFNPTGSVFDRKQMEAFMAKVPDNVMVVVDEAYMEFVTDPEV
ncbi:MAG: aminotransferase class I/II-fold pyridoxal phosphate-dependent enzyme, partial [Desulfobacteraceae bacterium]